MADFPRRPADSYSPLYFLASLGAGGARSAATSAA